MFQVITDTSANLPTELAEQNDIIVIPFTYYVNGTSHACMDTGGFDGEAFYGAMREGADVTTSQINPQHYVDVMRPILQKGTDVLFVGMSSGISGAYHSAELAAQELLEEFPERRIRLVDTIGASLGEGLLVLEAARDRQLGLDLDEVYEKLMDLRHRMCNIFTVDDLKYLRKGGRLSNLSFIVGTLLHIKPLLKGNEEGRIVAFGKVRGRRKSVEALGAMYDRLAVDPGEQIVGVVHAACREDADYLIELLNRSCPPKEIILADYEPVTGCHVGPGALALFFESEEGVRSYGNEGITGGLKEAMKVGENALKGLVSAEAIRKTGRVVSENAKKVTESAKKVGETARKAGESAAATISGKIREFKEK